MRILLHILFYDQFGVYVNMIRPRVRQKLCIHKFLSSCATCNIFLALAMQYVVFQTREKRCKWPRVVPEDFRCLQQKNIAATVKQIKSLHFATVLQQQKYAFRNKTQYDFRVAHRLQHIFCKQIVYDYNFQESLLHLF